MLKDKINKLLLMSKNVKKTRYIVLFLAVAFTLLGTVSIVSVLLFLNSAIKLNFFIMLALGIGAASIYSSSINELLNKIEYKNKIRMEEIAVLEKELKDELIQNYESDIIRRFNALDRKKKIELLKDIRSEMFLVLDEKKLEKMDLSELLFISKTFALDELDKNSVKKKK